MPMPFLGDELGHIEPIRAFRMRQYTDGTLQLQIEAPRALTADEQAAVRAVFAANGLADLPLHVEHLARIDWPPGRKREEFERVDRAFEPPPQPVERLIAARSCPCSRTRPCWSCSRNGPRH